MLKEQEALEVLTSKMTEPEEASTAQHRRDHKAYEAWKKKNSLAHIMFLSSMDDDIMREFRHFNLVSEMWSALRSKFDGTPIMKHRSLTIKSDTYKKHPDHIMKKHMRHMSNMISELKDAGHTLTDEQEVQAVIRSLPNSWEHMKMHLILNKCIKIMEDAMHHLKLKEVLNLCLSFDKEQNT